MKRNTITHTATIAAAFVLSTGSIAAFAAGNLQQGNPFGGNTSQGMMGAGMNAAVSYAAEASEIVSGDLSNSAAALAADMENASCITMSEENSEVTIKEAGTYVISGSCSDGNITVKKGTTGVVLILQDLDLTSTTGAAVSCNKGSEVQIIIQGNVILTDAENAADENSTDEAVADAFDGAALKAKAGSAVYLTGDGTLTINGSCKNGIKVGSADEEYGTPVFTIGGGLTLNITAANDAINSGYNLTIESGTLNIAAGDDAIHADRVLQIGNAGNGPVININSSTEGLEGTVVTIAGGTIAVNASDDGINAANSDGTYSSELAYSINITGGSVSVNCSGDGLDSNGNINITGGYTVINSGTAAGEGGLDYTGSCYVADGTLQNNGGVTFDSGMGSFGPMGEMQGSEGQEGFGPMGEMQGSEGQEGFGPMGEMQGFEGQEGFGPMENMQGFEDQEGFGPMGNMQGFEDQEGLAPMDGAPGFTQGEPLELPEGAVPQGEWQSPQNPDEQLPSESTEAPAPEEELTPDLPQAEEILPPVREVQAPEQMQIPDEQVPGLQDEAHLPEVPVQVPEVQLPDDAQLPEAPQPDQQVPALEEQPDPGMLPGQWNNQPQGQQLPVGAEQELPVPAAEMPAFPEMNPENAPGRFM